MRRTRGGPPASCAPRLIWAGAYPDRVFQEIENLSFTRIQGRSARMGRGNLAQGLSRAKGISSPQLSKELGIPQVSIWSLVPLPFEASPMSAAVKGYEI